MTETYQRINKMPSTVQAVKWDGDMKTALPFAAGTESLTQLINDDLLICHQGGEIDVRVGEYIVSEEGGDLLSFPSDIFELTYEKVEDNVVSMAVRQDDATLWSPEDALNDALNDVKNGNVAFAGKKILIVALNDDSAKYDTSFTQAGMNVSELISLIDVLKHYLIKIISE